MKMFIKKLLVNFKNRNGYSLAELSISTSIIAMLAVGGLAIMQKKNEADKIKETYSKIAKIETAIKGFIRLKGYIPCPSRPDLLESNTNFGRSEGMTADPTVTPNITVATIYDGTTTKTCANNGLLNETGAIPVRTLGLNDDYTYDGWGRKFTFRTASSSGSVTDFGDYGFKGNIAIIDLKGTHKTNINEPAPNNDGAIYVIISHGANGKNVAWHKNDSTQTYAAPPSQASGVEAKNTTHTRNIYVQNDKTTIFDDIVAFGTKAKVGRQNVLESPLKVQDITCDTAQSLTKDGRTTLNNYASSNSNAYGSHANTIYKSAGILANLCKNRKRGETISPNRVNGLSLWLDAADRATLFTGSDCVTGAKPVNSNNIGCWKDKSANNNNAVQAGSQPTYITNVINARPVIRFSGSNTLVATATGLPTGSAARTVFAVYSQPSAQTASIWSWGTGGAAGLFNLTTSQITFQGATTNAVSILSNAAGTTEYFGWFNLGINTPNIVDFSFAPITTSAGSSMQNGIMYLNGATTGEGMSYTAGTAVINTGAGSFYVGSAAGASLFTGDIAELIVYNKVLGASEHSKLEEYLAEKWSIALANPTKATCDNGMVFQKTAADPQGSCQCPAGTVYFADLKTTNACYTTADSTRFSGCVAKSSAPTYTNSPNKDGMVLWLDANDCTTVTIPSGVNTASVSAWADKSYAANNASQATTANMPLYVPNAKNNQAIIRFDGINNVMSTPTGLLDSIKQNVTVFLVASTANLVGANSILFNHSDDGDNRFNIHLPIGAGQLYWDFGNISDGQRVDCPWAASLNTFYVWTYNNDFVNVSKNIWKNGQTWQGTAVNWLGQTYHYYSSAPAVSSGVDFGGEYPSTPLDIGNAYAGDIAEVIIYNYALSNQKREAVESYLATKWQIPRIPTELTNANLKLWLDAADATTLYTDSSCGTLASPWEKVGCWKDKSINGFNATQSVDNYKPIYSPNTLNYKPVLAFNGLSTYLNNTSLSITSPANMTSGMTASIFAVANAGSASSGKIIINNDFNFYLGVGPTTTNYFNSFYGNSAAWGTTADHGGSPNMGTTYHVLTSINDNAKDYSYLDGTALTSRSNTMAIFSDGYTIGARQTTNSQYWDGNIAEIIIYRNALSTTERQAIEMYLGNKWNVP